MTFFKRLKIKEPFALFSNMVFLIPLYIAIQKDMELVALAIFLVFIFSILFHYFKPSGPVWWSKTGKLTIYQEGFLWLDTFVAMGLIFLNLFIFWQKGISIEFLCAIIIFAVGLFFDFFMTKKRQYDFCHGVWHIFASLGTLLAVIA